MTTKKVSAFKEAVFNQCKSLLEQRITHAGEAMRSAQEAANSEDKSSAGDKYETSRAMGQLDRDMNAKQMAEAQSELNALMKLSLETQSAKITSGSLVETNNGIYFIAVGIGIITLQDQKVIVLSSKAPLATAMMGKSVNEEFSFNERKIKITGLS